jgi:DNA-binding response OmpR family regulator
MRGNILLVNNSRDIQSTVRIVLEKEGYEVSSAADGEEGVKQASKGHFDLIILECLLPKVNGFEAAREIRQFTDCPILFLTSLTSDGDKIAAYRAGGDDFLSEPFTEIQLILSVNSLVRREASPKDNHSHMIVLDINGKAFFKNGKKIPLTDIEFELLRYLYQNKGRIITIEELYCAVWNEKPLATGQNTINVHILNVRKRIEDNYHDPKILKTVWGKGYIFEDL